MITTSTLFLLITSLVTFVTAHKVYITPDDHLSTSDNNTLSLSHVLSHPTKYLTSGTQLLLAPGWYYLKTDFVVQNVRDISIIGNYCTIQCANPSVGIAIINVTNIVMKNLEISECGKKHSDILVNTYTGPVYDDMPKLHWRSALLLHYCVSVVVTNVSVTVGIGTDGMLVVNAMNVARLTSVHVTIAYLPQQNVFNAATNGILVYHNKLSEVSKIFIQNFTYSQKSLNLLTGIQTVLYILLVNMKYGVLVKLYDCEYRNLHNVSILYYNSYTYLGLQVGLFHPEQRCIGHHGIYFNNLSVYNNTGNGSLNLFVFKYHICWASVMQYVKISNSKFHNNININSVITVDNNKPCLTKQPTILTFYSCTIR